MSDIEKTPPTIIVPGVKEALRADIVFGVCEEVHGLRKDMSSYEAACHSVMPQSLENKLVELCIHEWQPEYSQMPLEAVKSDLEDRVRKSTGMNVLTAVVLGIIFLPVLPFIVAGVCAWYVVDKMSREKELNAVRELAVSFDDIKLDDADEGGEALVL